MKNEFGVCIHTLWTDNVKEFLSLILHILCLILELFTKSHFYTLQQNGMALIWFM